MKLRKKLTALLLCLLLTLGLSATAFAADGADPSEIAREFLALLKADGVEYDDLGLNDNGRYRIEITYKGTNLPEHDVVLIIDEDGLDYSMYEWYLMDYDDARLVDVLKTVNNLNLNYRFAAFIADTTDNTITAKSWGSLQGNAKQSAAILHYAYDWLPTMVDRVWPALEAGVLGGDVEPEDADFVDSWYFSSMTFSDDYEGAAGQTMTAEDLGRDFVVITFRQDGTVELTSSSDVEGDVTDWEQDGIYATIDDDGDDILVTMTDEDTILLDAMEVAGYMMTLVREGSEAYQELAA